jgi:hypothetical protein
MKMEAETVENYQIYGDEREGDNAAYCVIFYLSLIVGIIIGLLSGFFSSLDHAHFVWLGYPSWLIVLGVFFAVIFILFAIFERNLSLPGVAGNLALGLVIGYLVFYTGAYWLTSGVTSLFALIFKMF